MEPDLLKKYLYIFLVAAVMPLAICTALLCRPGFAFAAGSDLFPGEAGIPQSSLTGPFRADTTLSGGKFLVAARSIRDPRFMESVILLVNYDSNGAMGLIINLPTGASLSSVLPDVKELRKRTDKIFIGGPVSGNQLFLLIRTDKPPEGSLRIFGHTYLNASITALKKVVRDRKKGNRFRVFAGYAGWAGGQLEREVAMGSWYVVDADEKIIFDKDPSGLWQRLIGGRSGIMVRLLPDYGRYSYLSAAE